MVVYYEVVFLSDAVMDGFLLCLSSAVLKLPLRPHRLFVSACVGGGISLLCVLFPAYKVYLFLVGLLILPALVKKHARIKEYLSAVLAFLAAGAVVAGLSVALISLGIDRTELFFGKTPILVGSSGILAVVFVARMQKNLPSIRNKNEYSLSAFLATGGREIRFSAFYDSGNRVYSDDGKRVVFVSDSVYAGLVKEKEETLSFRTAGGVCTSKMTPAELRVCYADGKCALYQVMVASARQLKSDRLILHGEMGGI